MSLARLFHSQGMFHEAEPLFRETLEAHRRILGDSHPGALNSMNNLALLLKDQGKFDEAEPLLKDALRVSHLTLGYVHPDTLAGISNLGLLLKEQGKFEEAEPLLREAAEGLSETTAPGALTAITNLGTPKENSIKRSHSTGGHWREIAPHWATPTLIHSEASTTWQHCFKTKGGSMKLSRFTGRL